MATRPKKRAASKEKNSLVANINRRRRAGKSRSKRNSTVSADAYARMRQGWPKRKKKKKKSARRRAS